MTGVSGGASSTYVYDGDGNLVKMKIGATTTALVGKHFESTGNITKTYYYAGATRIAVREGSTYFFLLTDHLGSTAVTTDNAGANLAELRYRAYGLTRLKAGTQKTPYRYTGQRIEGGTDLYYYGARWYDPVVGRFLQADTIVPNPGNPQDLNRYAYGSNNPLKFIDPTGHAYFMDVDANLRFDPVNGSIIVPSTGGSPLYALIALMATGSANSAQQRLDQILSQTKTIPHSNMHLSGLGAAKGDRGFRREFADDHLYSELWGYGAGPHSNQVGHLLTAIATSYGGGTEFWMRLDIGHEKINDGRTVGSRGWKILPQYGAATSSDLQLFGGALSADAQGDYAQRDANLSAILAWDTTYGPQFSRIGNSMEDLRLTVRGWNLGQLVLSGALQTNRDLAAWIALNIAE